MTEHIGLIKSAGLNEDEKFVVQVIEPDWKYYIYATNTKIQKVATDNIGKKVKVTYKLKEGTNLRNVQSIEPIAEATGLKSEGLNGGGDKNYPTNEERTAENYRVTARGIVIAFIEACGGQWTEDIHNMALAAYKTVLEMENCRVKSTVQQSAGTKPTPMDTTQAEAKESKPQTSGLDTESKEKLNKILKWCRDNKKNIAGLVEQVTKKQIKAIKELTKEDIDTIFEWIGK